MSFKVGDLVVRLDLDSPYTYTVFKIEDGIHTIGRKKRARTWGTWLECNQLRHATPEEIAAGHRIDHCVEATKKVELFGNSEELEVLEMIDVSPNCEVSEI